MREHLSDYWWLYLIFAFFGSMLAVIVDEHKRDGEAIQSCVLSGLMPVVYRGEIYCAPAQELVKP